GLTNAAAAKNRSGNWKLPARSSKLELRPCRSRPSESRSEESSMFRLASRAAAVAAALGLCLTAAAQDNSTIKVKVGDKFPDVPLHAAQVEKIPGKKPGDTVRISDLK